jgi:hypothetical protein
VGQTDENAISRLTLLTVLVRPDISKEIAEKLGLIGDNTAQTCRTLSVTERERATCSSAVSRVSSSFVSSQTRFTGRRRYFEFLLIYSRFMETSMC